MPSKKQSQTKSAQTKDTQHQAIRNLIDAVNMADSGLSCMEEMRSILRAIYKLSSSDEVINGLAKVGLCLADDRHNMFDCESESMNQKLVDLKGKNHA